MVSTKPTAESIFLAAIELPPGQRDAYLIEACGNDPEVRARVERLLDAQSHVDSFLESPAPELGATADRSVTEEPGMVIGPYKLLQQIGEGGMGIVFMAEQSEPIQRTVALKIVKPGIDTRQVIARFEAERQALAMMDHPHIAKVFDAGATDAGHPYFVMELVQGLPITEYCDECQLPTRERLELFIAVCQAVQHAHQKGVIHRDIKPTNILVAMQDGRPAPKIIDFGVAKALNQRLTEHTLATGYSQMIGTPLYMSPEQAELSPLGADTRSDIYSLGVLLYELLTGTTPFDKERLHSASFDELRRILREEDPPRPSARLSTLNAQLATTVAEQHRTETRKLTQRIRGELDWIVMKALEKDRSRRYETASKFAEDIQHYLSDEAVEACPPSTAYRLRKFARRNKSGLSVAALVLFFLALLGSGVGWAVRDRTARQSRIGAQVGVILDEVDRLEHEQKWPEALAAARRAEAAAAGGDADAAIAQRVRQQLKDLEFIDRLEQVRMMAETWVEGGFDQATADREYARAFREYGVNVEALAVEAATERLRARPALAIPLATALDDWAQKCWSSRRDGDTSKRLVAVARGIDADPLRYRMRATWGKSATEVGDEHRRLAESIDVRAEHPVTLGILAGRLLRMNHRDLAVRLLRDAQRAHPGDYWLNYTLAERLAEQKDDEGAVRFYTAAVSVRPRATAALNNLGNALHRQKKLDEAIAVYRRALEIDPNFTYAHDGLGNALKDQGKLDKAINHYSMAIELDPKAGHAHMNLGLLLHQCRQEYDKAVAAFRRAIELDPKNAAARYNLGHALKDMGKVDEAITQYRQALELDPNYINAHIALGLALKHMGELDEAITHYRRAIELDAKNVGAHTNLGIALASQGKPDEATRHFRTALELDPRYANAHGALGLRLAIQGKFAEAIDHYSTAIELDPKRADTHFLLGYALARMEKLDEAIDHFRTSLELDPKSADAHEELGIALANMGNLDEAVPHFRKVMELDPKRPDAHFNLGSALSAQGDIPEAIDAYRKAIELDPKSAKAYGNLGLTLRDQKKLEEAVAAYRRAIELDPKNAAPRYSNLGALLCDDLAKYDEAVACFRKAIELDPKFADAYSNLGVVLGKQEKWREAIAAHNQALAIDPQFIHARAGLAWIFATCSAAKLRDPKRAVTLAGEAVKRDPTNWDYYLTLGAAHYRTGEWNAAVAALEKSIELRNADRSDRWFFLAMAQWQLGNKETARNSYRKAVEWMDKNNTKNAELIHFRNEAADLLDINQSQSAPDSQLQEK